VELVCLNGKKDGLKQGFSWDNFAAELLEWYKKEKRILDSKEADKPKYLVLEDKYDSIMILFRNSNATTPFEFIQEIDDLFPKEQNGNGVITLCSIHKAKGLERQAVVVLEYDKLPFAWKGITDEQYKQEGNLLLVALTRSKEYMALVQSPKKEGEDEW
jgi:superfamily I DNA/RNA helicase